MQRSELLRGRRHRLERHGAAAIEHEVVQLHRVAVFLLALNAKPLGCPVQMLRTAPGRHREIFVRGTQLGIDLLVEGLEDDSAHAHGLEAYHGAARSRSRPFGREEGASLTRRARAQTGRAEGAFASLTRRARAHSGARGASLRSAGGAFASLRGGLAPIRARGGGSLALAE